ncbi:MAG: hypothetical protein Kow0092_10380 [Deferrisomatales bacterium]
MTVPRPISLDVPPEAVPFLREFLVELARRIPADLGSPPVISAGDLREAGGCAEAARELIRWLEGVPAALGRRMEEFETTFASLLELVRQLDARIHRVVHRSRRWAEEEITFAHTMQEVLAQLETAIQKTPCHDQPSATVRELLRRIEAKQRADQEEAGDLSAQFEEAQQDLARLRAQVARVEQRTRELRDQSLRDGLTGLWNRRAYDDRVREEVARAERYGGPLSLALWDVDRFKDLNDTHGHRTGDAVLHALGNRILGLLRRSDFLARYGGEEFAVILPNTDGAQALLAGRKICSAIAEAPVETAAGPLSVTVSVGVACVRPGDTPESLFERADRALYRAKEAGRNRVETLPS